MGEEDDLLPKNEAFSMLLSDLEVEHTFSLVESEGHRLGHFFQLIDEPFEFYARVFAAHAGDMKPTRNTAALESFTDRITEAMVDRGLHASASGVKVISALVEEFRQALEF